MDKVTKTSQQYAGALLSALMLVVTGCAGGSIQDPETMTKPNGPQVLFGAVWQVEDIDMGGIIDRSHITMQMSPDDRIVGSTGCNQYFGTLNLGTTAFEVSGAGSTRRACVPAIMEQETRFLRALHEVRRYEIDGDYVRLYDESNIERMRMIRTTEQPGS